MIVVYFDTRKDNDITIYKKINKDRQHNYVHYVSKLKKCIRGDPTSMESSRSKNTGSYLQYNL
jgi:hypothetical protein